VHHYISSGVYLLCVSQSSFIIEYVQEKRVMADHSFPSVGSAECKM